MVQVDSAWDAGDYQEARKSSFNARKWSIVSIVSGAIITMITIVLQII